MGKKANAGPVEGSGAKPSNAVGRHGAIRVAQLRTGQFVLSHEPSGTIVVAESLPDAWEELKAELGDQFQVAAERAEPAPAAREGGRSLLLLALALLPFLWLGILHYSLGALVDEGLVRAKGVFEARDTAQSLNAEVQSLRVAQAELEKQFAIAKSQMAPAPEDLLAMRRELDAMNRRMGVVDPQLTTLAQQSVTATDGLGALKARVDQIEARLTPVPTPATTPTPGN